MSDEPTPVKRSALRALVGLKASAGRAKAKVKNRQEAQGKLPERGSFEVEPGAGTSLGKPKSRMGAVGAAGSYTLSRVRNLIPGRSNSKGR